MKHFFRTYFITVESLVAITSRERQFQNTKSFLVKSLYLKPLVGDHISKRLPPLLELKVKYSFVHLVSDHLTNNTTELAFTQIFRKIA